MNAIYQYNLGQFFNQLALENPNNPALNFIDGKVISYGEINEFSNKLAHFLINKGIERNDVIAILNNKSTIAYSLMLACLKIGAIYTNLDPWSPIERFDKMLALSCPKVVFYFSQIEKPTIAEGYPFTNFEAVDYQSDLFLEKTDSFSNLLPQVTASVPSNSPAYIMFTSGSTGFPKGVIIKQSSIINFIKWSKQTYSVTVKDIFTNLNPMHFDNSVFDFYSSLFNGASLIPISEDLTLNPRYLLNALNRIKPTIWFSVPSMLVYALNMRAIKSDDLQDLRVVTFGGEGFPKNQLRKLWEIWGGRIVMVNVYGPTECTCICSSHIVTDEDINNDDLLPLGPIAPNFYAIVIDENGKEVEDGAIGELAIGGPNVGLGYYNNFEKTNEVFINNPLISSYIEKIYKTGDLVRYDRKKDLYHFCGRKDNQIKRMGYRIELEEIENALNSLSFIHECGVVFINTEAIKNKIVAYINSSKKDTMVIIDHLEKLIPRYMFPDEFIEIEMLPKNQNGKIDRLSLKKNFLSAR